MMADTLLIKKPKVLCDWCGRESHDALITATIVTPRGAFRDDICEPCYRAYAESAE